MAKGKSENMMPESEDSEPLKCNNVLQIELYFKNSL